MQGMTSTNPGRGRSAESLLEVSAFELAAAIRAGEVSATEVVETHLARIERVNGALNAVVVRRFEEARREAKAADKRVRAGGELPPLLGVPCTVKEFFGVAGLPQTGGLVARRHTRATEDAITVERLRAAGAIVVGTTNVPEGGIWLETYNAVYGRTNNPWDTTRTSGGSSGGEGAIVAAGGVPFGLGSDVGGSIRIPSAFCGVVGHKPSGRLVPNLGQFPSATGEALAYLCAGPIARRASDLMPLLRILAGPDPRDPAAVAMPLGDPATVALGELEVYAIPESGRFRVADAMKQAVLDGARTLERRGARLRDLDLPELRRGLEIWGAMLEEASEQGYEELLADGSDQARIAPLAELAKAVVGRSNHTLPALVVGVLGAAVAKLPLGAKKLVEEGRALKRRLDAQLGDRGVLLYPPYTRPAPRHHDVWRTPFDPAHTALFNVLELPGTVVPMGFDARGLPTSVQILGAQGRDHVTIAAALALEEAHGGWTMATPR